MILLYDNRKFVWEVANSCVLPQKLIELFPYVEQRITFIERLELEYSEKS